jgi:hypothetical protein
VEEPVDLIVNYTNCVQCRSITAKGQRPKLPESGDGPVYQVTGADEKRGRARS